MSQGWHNLAYIDQSYGPWNLTSLKFHSIEHFLALLADNDVIFFSLLCIDARKDI